MKSYWRTEGTARVLNLWVRWSSAVSFTPRSLIPG